MAPLRQLPTIRQLRAFVAVFRNGQLSEAAQQLALTQPAVTVLLRDLEDKLGVRLFDRTTRQLQPTEAAQEAIGYAERALAEMEAMGHGMAELAALRRGRLHITATSAIAQTLLPKAVRRFQSLHHDIELLIDDCSAGEFADRILSGQATFGIGTLESPINGLTEQVFLKDPLCAAALPELFSSPRPLTWKQAARYPLITMKPGYGVRRRIDQAAAEAGVTLRMTHEVSLLTTALAIAANGLGVAVVPASVLAHSQFPTLVGRPLSRPTVYRHVAVVSRSNRSLSPSAQAFTAMLQAEFGIP